VTALYLLQTDPVRELPDRAAWHAALHHAALVVAHASVLTEGLHEHATVIFPAESHAEKDGTVVHPDGRLQRLRTAIARPGEVRAGWQVIAEVSKRAGLDQAVLTGPMAFKALTEAVPFYAGLTLEALGGRGVRWPAGDAAAAMPVADNSRLAPDIHAAPGPAPEQRDGTLRVGTYRSIWASPEVELSPALHFAIAEQLVELSPADAQRLGIRDGTEVTIAQLDDSGAARSGEAGRRAGGKPEGTRLAARAAVRTGVPAGTAFLADGIAQDSANILTESLVEVTER
jgi:NADH-quinone oxidoreductase subunit G